MSYPRAHPAVLQALKTIGLSFLVALAALPAANAVAQSSWMWRSNTAIHSQQFQGPASTATRRTLDSRLQITHHQPRLTAHTSARYQFDHALANPSPLAQYRHLSPALEAAWLLWTPLQSITLTAGRLDLLQSMQPARIDGISARFDPQDSSFPLWLSFAAGWRTNEVLRPIDDPTFHTLSSPSPLSDSEGRLVFQQRPASTLLHAGTGITLPAFSLGVDLRDERAPTRNLHTSSSVQLTGHLGQRTRTHLRFLHTQHLLFNLPERASAHLLIPISHNLRIDAGARLDRLLLPLDSPFAIYTSAASAESWVGAAWRRSQLVLSARSTATSSLRSPLTTSQPPLFGLRARSTATFARHGRLEAGAAAWLSNALHRRAQAWSSLAWPLRRGPDLHAQLATFASDDARSLQPTAVAGAFCTAGATFRATPWAHFNTLATGGYDSRRVMSASILVTADLRLASGAR